MNIDEFWQLIEKTKIESEGDTEKQTQLLEDTLVEMSVEDIMTFQSFYFKYDGYADRGSLWDAHIIMTGFVSNDFFTDFRGWLIAQGKQLYETVVKDPETLVDYVDINSVLEVEAEAMAVVAVRAYRRKIGSHPDADIQIPYPYPEVDVKFEGAATDKGCIWVDEDKPQQEPFEECIKKRYPKLCAKFQNN